MKATHVVAFSIIFGGALGLGEALYSIRSIRWDGTGSGTFEAKREPILTMDARIARAEVSRPEVTVDNATYNFGVMDSRSKKSHEFVLTNRGTAAAALAKGPTSCRCTSFELEKTTLDPGESTKATVEWHAKNSRGPFRQTAMVRVTDGLPPEVILSVEGRVLNAVKVDPQEWGIGSIGAGTGITRDFALFTFSQEPIKVLKHELLQAETKAFFDVKIVPMPPERLASEPEAKGGSLIHVSLKPGLPTAPFQQRIRVTTDFKDAPEVEIPIWGKVVSDLSITGRSYDEETGVLALGVVESKEGAERQLLVLARGENRKDLKITLGEVVPDWLKVEVGAPRQILGGNVVEFPVTLRIPKGSRPAQHLGPERENYGKVTLQTTHPAAPKLPIYVRFGVRD
jgi:hypothetical protein